MNTHEVLQRVPSLTRQELYRYEAKGYIKPQVRVVGKTKRQEFTEEEAEFIRLIKYHHMTGWASERSLKQAYQLALRDMGKGVNGVLKTY